MRYWSPGDEAAFFSWLKSIPGVVAFKGVGRELHIQLKSKRISQSGLRELIALYTRFGGNHSELAQLLTPANQAWLKEPSAFWHTSVFGVEAKHAA